MSRLRLLKNKLGSTLIAWGHLLRSETNEQTLPVDVSASLSEDLNNAPPRHWLELVRAKAPQYYNDLQQRGAVPVASLQANDQRSTLTKTAVGSAFQELNDSRPPTSANGIDDPPADYPVKKSHVIASKPDVRHSKPVALTGVSIGREIDTADMPVKISTRDSVVKQANGQRACDVSDNRGQIVARQSRDVVAAALIPSHKKETNAVPSVAVDISAWPELSTDVFSHNSEQRYQSPSVNPVELVLSQDDSAMSTASDFQSQHPQHKMGNTSPAATIPTRPTRPVTHESPPASPSLSTVIPVLSQSSDIKRQNQPSFHIQQRETPTVANNLSDHNVASCGERKPPVETAVNNTRYTTEGRISREYIFTMEGALSPQDTSPRESSTPISWPNILSASVAAGADVWPSLLVDTGTIQTVKAALSHQRDSGAEKNSLQKRADLERTGNLWNA